MSLDSEQLGIPETEYSSIVTLPSAEFTRICKELSSIAETGTYYIILALYFFNIVNIETSKEYVKFSINGENGTGNITLKQKYDPEKKDENVTLEVDEPVNLSFALRYLNLFNKASNLSPSVTLHLSNETPLVVEYTIEKLGSLKFYLAPKINDEQEGN